MLVKFLRVCVCARLGAGGVGWEKPGGTEHKGTSEGAHCKHPYHPLLFHPPPSLLQSWACTLAVAPAASAEARLLFKAALSFGLFSFLYPPFFFSADVNRVASQSSLRLAHLIYKTTKEGANERKEEEESQNKMGTVLAQLFLALPPPLMTFVVSVRGKKIQFQSSPSFSQQRPDSSWSRDGLNVDQLCVVVLSKYSGTTRDIGNFLKKSAGVCRWAFNFFHASSFEAWRVTEKVEFSVVSYWRLCICFRSKILLLSTFTCET